jgi:xanthine dehydrogenase YagT iron-sulfur-binding subunit
MSIDNATPPDESRRPQARRLAELALQAEREGDTQTSDRLLEQARRVDQDAVIEVLNEAEATGVRKPAKSSGSDHAPSPTVSLAGPGPRHLMGTAGMRRAKPEHATSRKIDLFINGQAHSLTVDVRATLLDALRDHLNLTGTKKGCALGQCGSCTVLMDGRRVNACLSLAAMAEGRAITTIEGLSTNGALHPMQAAFVARDAYQCGYCTPGQIMSAVGLLSEGHGQDDADIREQMSGNICRCGAYDHIVAAIRDVRDGQEG